MAEIGKLYILAKDPEIASYAMSDTYDIKRRKFTEWIRAEAFQMPFMIVEEYGAEGFYWIKILLGDKTGWINVYEDQLRLIKPYR
jgi:hypothetical protein